MLKGSLIKHDVLYIYIYICVYDTHSYTHINPSASHCCPVEEISICFGSAARLKHRPLLVCCVCAIELCIVFRFFANSMEMEMDIFHNDRCGLLRSNIYRKGKNGHS